MADLLITAEMPRTGVDSGDKAVNTFAFHKPGAYVAGEATALFDELQEFYSITPTGGLSPVGGYFSSSLDRTVDICTFKAYDITGKLGLVADPVTGKRRPVPHGSPIAQGTWELQPAGSSNDLPAQVAAVVTLRARQAWTYPVETPDAGDLGSEPDRPRARRTGRLYLGPLNDSASTSGSTPKGHIRASFRGDVLAACEGLSDGAAALGYGWAVWSRTNEALSIIERVEIDDSFDVIRSRKSKPTLRDVRTFSPVPDLALGA